MYMYGNITVIPLICVINFQTDVKKFTIKKEIRTYNFETIRARICHHFKNRQNRIKQMAKKQAKETPTETKRKYYLNWVFMPVIPALRRMMQEDHKFKASLTR
jgi:hypothetical protein